MDNLDGGRRAYILFYLYPKYDMQLKYLNLIMMINDLNSMSSTLSMKSLKIQIARIYQKLKIKI